MQSALARALDKVADLPTFGETGPYNYGTPVSPTQVAEWQAQLDREFYRGPHFGRLLLRFDPGDPWQPINRFFLWQAVDPRYVKIEPWVLRALKGPSPRSTGHYCGDGYCLCAVKHNRWDKGATRHVDTLQWRIYRETGLYATRWWVLQGNRGGHRYAWETTELASLVSQMKTGERHPPEVCSLPPAPFDARVLKAIRLERRASGATRILGDLWRRRDQLTAEDKEAALAARREIMAWIDAQTETMMGEGLDILPQYFEELYGRAPVGHKVTTDYEKEEELFVTAGVE